MGGRRRGIRWVKVIQVEKFKILKNKLTEETDKQIKTNKQTKNKQSQKESKTNKATKQTNTNKQTNHQETKRHNKQNFLSSLFTGWW